MSRKYERDCYGGGALPWERYRGGPDLLIVHPLVWEAYCKLADSSRIIEPLEKRFPTIEEIDAESKQYIADRDLENADEDDTEDL